VNRALADLETHPIVGLNGAKPFRYPAKFQHAALRAWSADYADFTDSVRLICFNLTLVQPTSAKSV